jgi:2-polyprenyl-6-hydroxyphenyl methylase / 3-demethylubiquinone-9 3-methyltransferase
VLDVGCGGGILAEAMARRGASVTGIDLAKPLGVARLHALEAVSPTSSTARSRPRRWPQSADSFDVVTCMEMLEHVPDPRPWCAPAPRWPSRGGWVFFSTLNRNPKSFLFAIVGAEYVLKPAAQGHARIRALHPPSELARWCREAGLSLQGSRGMEYNPLTRRYWLSDDTSVNYLWRAGATA